MQIYVGMDVGTAKPTPSERAAVPHHLIDCLTISEPYSVNRFLALAQARLGGPDSGKAEGPRAWLLVGGSGLYARALTRGYDLLPADPAVARQLLADYAAPGGPRRLAEELARTDAALAGDAARNPRRLLRVLEVLRVTGRTPTEWRRHHCSGGLRAAAGGTEPRWLEIILMPPWERHRGAIADRTDAMLARGWIAETAQLVAAGLEESPTARQALGYGEIASFLRGQLRSAEELRDRLVLRTVQYARRQRTWFRHQHPDAIVVADWFADDAAAAERLLEVIGSEGG